MKMDDTLVAFLSAIVLLLFSSAVVIFMQQKLFSKPAGRSSSKLPPGPKPLPVIGNLLELGNQPHRSLAKLSETHGPLMTLHLGSITTVVVSSSEKAKLVLQKFDHLLSNRSVPDVAHAVGHSKYSVAWLPVSPKWRLLRKVLAVQVFSPKRLEAGQALRHQKVKQLIDFVRETSKNSDTCSIDIGQVAFLTSLNLLSNTFFSMDFGRYESDSSQEFRNLIVEVFELAGAPNVADFFPALKFIDPQSVKRRMKVPFRKLLDNFQGIINERVKSRRLKDPSAVVSDEDILDVLLNLRHDDPNEVTDSDIIHLLLDVFSAGTDTSSSTVEWAMSELMRNPAKMAKVRAELAEVIGNNREKSVVQETDIRRLPYLNAIVKETLRLHPPAPLLLPRRAETDVEIDGFVVPLGSRVFVNAWAMGRDPQTWTDPLSFEPERFLGGRREIDYRGRDFELVPFGGGRRICPGLPLAHQMIHLMLASLLHSFEWELKDGMKPEDINMNERFGLTLLKADPLILRAILPQIY